LDELADVGKRVAKVVQQLSKVGPRLTIAGVGPQLKRESRAMLQVWSHGDQRQEALQAKRVEGAETAAV
jgi:hypothetical protein